MKKLLYFLFIVFFQFHNNLCFSQQEGGILNIVSDDKKKFFLIINGIRKNEVSVDSIEVRDIKETFCNIKLIFDDLNIKPISEDVLLKTSAGYVYAKYKLNKVDDNRYQLELISIENISKKQKETVYKNEVEGKNFTLGVKDTSYAENKSQLKKEDDKNKSSYNYSELTISSKVDKKFWVIVDGQKINSEPSYKVVVPEIKTKNVYVKILFENDTVNFIDEEIGMIDQINKSYYYRDRLISAQVNAYTKKHYVIEKRIKKYFLSSKTTEYYALKLVNSEPANPQRVYEFLSNELEKKKIEVDEMLKKEAELRQKQDVINNLSNLVLVKVITKSDLLGPSDVRVLVCNNTGYLLDQVLVNVEYRGIITDKIKCLYTVTFNNVKPDGRWYELPSPLCSEGRNVQVSLSKVISKELGLR